MPNNIETKSENKIDNFDDSSYQATTKKKLSAGEKLKQNLEKSLDLGNEKSKMPMKTIANLKGFFSGEIVYLDKSREHDWCKFLFDPSFDDGKLGSETKFSVMLYKGKSNSPYNFLRGEGSLLRGFYYNPKKKEKMFISLGPRLYSQINLKNNKQELYMDLFSKKIDGSFNLIGKGILFRE